MKQTEESFLSCIINLDSIRKDKLNLIQAPCGSGKTTLALEKMPKKNYIINNAAIPDDIDVLFINKSCETSINIKSHVDYMVIHTTELDTKLQAMGRYRGDLDLVYIYWPSENERIELPEEMQNIPLFKEELEVYIYENNIRNSKGELMKTPSFLQLLKDQGYHVTPGKIRRGTRYHTLSRSA